MQTPAGLDNGHLVQPNEPHHLPAEADEAAVAV